MTDIKKSRSTEEQIISFLRKAEAGMPIKEGGGHLADGLQRGQAEQQTGPNTAGALAMLLDTSPQRYRLTFNPDFLFVDWYCGWGQVRENLL